MGFIAVSLTGVSSGLSASYSIEQRGYNVLFQDIANIKCSQCIQERQIDASYNDLGNMTSFSFGFVYTLEELRYLDVSPNEVVWISPYEAIVYHVSSNTDWKVDY